MAMTSKDYRAFAEMLKEVRNALDVGCDCEQYTVNNIEDGMIRIFKADNPRFQEGYFREASGSLNQMV